MARHLTEEKTKKAPQLFHPPKSTNSHEVVDRRSDEDEALVLSKRAGLLEGEQHVFWLDRRKEREEEEEEEEEIFLVLVSRFFDFVFHFCLSEFHSFFPQSTFLQLFALALFMPSLATPGDVLFPEVRC